MKKQTIIASGIAVIVGLSISVLAVGAMNKPVDTAYGYNSRLNGQTRTFSAITPVQDLTVIEVQNLEATLTVLINDEYNAKAVYVALVEKFGEVSPFVNLIKAETQHISALTNQFVAYGFTVPADNSNVASIVPDTLEEAYAIGLQAEINNIKLYEDFLKQDFPVNVEKVFTSLMNASKSHLATFQSYVDGTAPVVHTSLNVGGKGFGRGSK